MRCGEFGQIRRNCPATEAGDGSGDQGGAGGPDDDADGGNGSQRKDDQEDDSDEDDDQGRRGGSKKVTFTKDSSSKKQDYKPRRRAAQGESHFSGWSWQFFLRVHVEISGRSSSERYVLSRSLFNGDDLRHSRGTCGSTRSVAGVGRR